MSRSGVDAWSLGCGRVRTKGGGVGWRTGSGRYSHGVTEGMAETETAPGRCSPWVVMTLQKAMSRVQKGGALCGGAEEASPMDGGGGRRA